MMNQYERRFYEDFHKLVIIQDKILKELKKMNEPLQEDKEYVVPIERMEELINIKESDK